MNFNKQQLEAINTIGGNISVIATAGSGKTTVLTHRIKNMVVKHGCNPSCILAVTFSKKAKESISQKLEELGVTGVNIETFHSLALKIILSTYGNDSYKVWTAQWEKEKLITDICKSIGVCSIDDVPYNDIVSFISLQKVNMLNPGDSLIYNSTIPFKKEDMEKIYRLYEASKQDKHYIEFDDFLNLANDIFDSYPDVLNKYQDIFKYVLSDEFQDISLSQALLLKKLNTQNTMIVGDPLQAIYSFRGGDSKYILNFDSDYYDTKVINLNTNYRCSKDIIATSNALAAHIPDSKHKNYVESIANNPSWKIPELYHFDSDYDESKWISEKILEIKKEYKYSDIAVLARTNAQLQKLESAFNENMIPFEIVNGKSFTDLPEIKLIVAYLRLSLHENDNSAFRHLYNKPNRWLSKKFMEELEQNSIRRNVSLYNAMFTIDRRNWRFKNGIDEIYEVTNHLQNKRFKNVASMVHYLRERLNIDDFVTKGKQSDDGSYIEQIDNLNSFENMCEKFDSIDKLMCFIDNLEKTNKEDESISNRVKLLTIHKSKGLEYPVVFIVGCNDGLIPHAKNNNVDDERRLLYVGLTRAEKELYLSYTDMSNGKSSSISPFMSDIKNTIKVIPMHKSENERRSN